MLKKVAQEKGYADTLFFVDDGITGTTMKRPGFQKMITAIETGYISAVFVKDLSRLGRNYIEVGKLMDTFFPEHDIRLVAVSRHYDSWLDHDAKGIVLRKHECEPVKLTWAKVAKSIDAMIAHDRYLTPEEASAVPAAYHTEAAEELLAEETSLPYDISFDNELPAPSAENFRITDDYLGEGGPKAKYRANMDAIYKAVHVGRGYQLSVDLNVSFEALRSFSMQEPMPVVLPTAI